MKSERIGLLSASETEFRWSARQNVEKAFDLFSLFLRHVSNNEWSITSYEGDLFAVWAHRTALRYVDSAVVDVERAAGLYAWRREAEANERRPRRPGRRVSKKVSA